VNNPEQKAGISTVVAISFSPFSCKAVILLPKQFCQFLEEVSAGI
jgi:hypothetical protein